MKKRVRLILVLVRTIARIQGAIMLISKVFRGAKPPPPRPERHLIVRPKGPMIHFMHAGFWPEKIVENYGVVGVLAPREQSPAGIRDNILDRVQELCEEGYQNLQDFDGAGLIECQNIKDLPAFENYLADRGLGLVTSLEGDAATVLSPAPDLAGPLISTYLEHGPPTLSGAPQSV